MRLCSILKGNGRHPAVEPFPFKTRRPLALRNKVSLKNDRESDKCCIQEMTILMACFKENEFQQAPCSSEILKFQKCVNDFQERRANIQMNGELATGEKTLNARQINSLLKMFP